LVQELQKDACGVGFNVCRFFDVILGLLSRPVPADVASISFPHGFCSGVNTFSYKKNTLDILIPIYMGISPFCFQK